ncbi:MAG TPA: hypothetical protein VGR64_06425 [Terracidiphilus sp.]|nr:hypothetical protein [Terracidiphilus sp.]
MKRMTWVIRLSAVAVVLAACAGMAAAQMPNEAEQAAQKEAMQKLAFLAGKWSGPISVQQGPGPALHMTQTESVEYKLDGLVMLLEGKSTDAAGKAEFAALATIAWDETAKGYRIRAYNAGHYVDEPLTVEKDGFSWGFDAGPVHIENSMQLASDGQWKETTQVTVPGRPAFQTVEMTLKHEQ